jgi:GPH family glycoside/pentoside/hexuronide:cation symporter
MQYDRDSAPQPAEHRRLSARARYGFAVGDFGLNLYWQGLGLFLIFFYTDVLGIPAAAAGLSYFVATLWDCVTDPAMGVLADRTRTRWGRYRSFLLFGSVPLAMVFALAFSGPALSTSGLIAWTLATHLLVRTLYTAVAIPYSALSASITRDSDERVGLTGLRMQFAFLGGFAVAYLIPALADAFGAGDPRLGYGLAAAATGALASVSFALCFASVREPEQLQTPRFANTSFVAEARAFLSVARRSAPLLRLLAGKFLITLTLTMHTRNMVYFFKYVLRDEHPIRYAIPLLGIASMLSVPLWVWVIRRTSKRGGWLIGSAVTCVCSLALYLPQQLSLVPAVALLAAIAMSSTAYGVCFWAMLPDTVEYNQWRFGRRDEAKVFGLASFIQKFAMGLSALITGATLDASGFVANQVQQPQALLAIRASMGLLPAIGTALSMLALWSYGLDSARHRQILSELDALPPAHGSD